jgi:hypothetical protein
MLPEPENNNKQDPKDIQLEREPIEVKRNKNKTIINPNRFKKKPFKRELENESQLYYCSDKEVSPKQWNTINYNVDIESLPLHLRIQPIKMTHKKVKDFLVKEKITNPNKNIPEHLANFLYSSITSNDYQVNFVDIINDN